MKSLCKRLFYLVSVFLKLIVSSFSVLFFSKFFKNKKIEQIKEQIGGDKECVVMGNGPSLTSLLDYYEENKNYMYFCMNFCCLTDCFEKTKPSYYILLDPVYFYDAYSENVAKMVQTLRKVDWTLNMFIPFRNRKSRIVQDLSKNAQINIVLYNSTPIDVSTSIDNIYFRFNWGMPWPETVAIAAIFEALQLGFKKIHLFGMEQSWLKNLSVSDDNTVSIGLQHYYGTTDTDTSQRLYSFLESQARAFRSHYRLAKFSDYIGVQIINNTPESYLDVYEKQIPLL